MPFPSFWHRVASSAGRQGSLAGPSTQHWLLHQRPVVAQELEFLHSMDESDDELPVPLVQRNFLQNICDAFVIAIQRCALDWSLSLP